MELIEKVARTLLRERHPCWSIVGEIFDPEGPHYNLDGQADEMRELAKVAIRAMLDKVEPVAWRYHFPGDLEHGWQRHEFERRIQSYEGMSCNEEDAGCIETPLYPLDALKEAL